MSTNSKTGLTTCEKCRNLSKAANILDNLLQVWMSTKKGAEFIDALDPVVYAAEKWLNDYEENNHE